MARPSDVTKTQLKHEQWLCEIAALPTAAGREQRVVEWVETWVRRRKGVKLTHDRAGNLLLKSESVTHRNPIVFEAHLDHPAFVVVEPSDGDRVTAQFRGGVQESYFTGTGVWLHHANGDRTAGTVTDYAPGPEGSGDGLPVNRATIALESAAPANVGDIVTWRVEGPRVDRRADRFVSPVCDNLASVAAALCAFDRLRAGERDVRVLLSRAEEVGFIGAIAAAKQGAIPAASRVIVLENSRSFADSPIGAGPIIRVGDRTSTFDPDLTYRIGRVAELLGADDEAFQYQRKLMPGGTCNASAYQAFGLAAACVCLPLGNYHNMDESTGRIAAEEISIADFHRLVRLLVSIGQKLDDDRTAPRLRERLERLFAARRKLLEE